MSFDSYGGAVEPPESDGESRRPGGAPSLAAGVEELVVDGIDVIQAKAALARLGERGSADLEALDAQRTIALLTELRKLSGAVAAIEARALVRLESAVADDSLERGETPRQAQRVARAEAAAALKKSTSAAGQSMSSCRRLVRSMPRVLRALAQGRAMPAAGHQVGRAMGPATPEQREQVDRILGAHLADLEDCGPGEWGDEAARILHALDPEGAAARHRVARRERSVTVRRGRHGMATLTAHLPGLDAARIRKTLSVAAERSRADGDRRGHQQIMADLLADTVLGRGEGGELPVVDIGVIITDRSLLAPGHADAATVEGLGAVPYEHIREEMLRALEHPDPEVVLALRKLLQDAEDGQLVAVESRSRAFPAGLGRLLRYAHQTCRAPHCDASIRQIDHIVPWSQGGPTSLDNGNGLCAADNQKEAAGATARAITDEDGTRRTVEWTTRYGQTARRRGVNFDPVGTALRKAGKAPAVPDVGEGGPAEPDHDVLTPVHRLFALPELRAVEEDGEVQAAEVHPEDARPLGEGPAPDAGPTTSRPRGTERPHPPAGRRAARVDYLVVLPPTGSRARPPEQDAA
ncbi:MULTISPECIES: HNH endonuclease signature motif containing protein [Brachybacterium]|uniref:HNH endonuclease n=1 Tax=Brachybacterium conglomeratum TaxID=47846 RepID=A0ABQ5RHG9_9MICO|nr:MULTISPECIES: HNH endonuclease signature motif containing protein [Brachybacterium]GLI30601.1 HNH endonuclease [Brachybacterium conglomeratum]GLK05115.1 HNH endonuclease [Brachybacterium conglomeratum]